MVCRWQEVDSSASQVARGCRALRGLWPGQSTRGLQKPCARLACSQRPGPRPTCLESARVSTPSGSLLVPSDRVWLLREPVLKTQSLCCPSWWEDDVMAKRGASPGPPQRWLCLLPPLRRWRRREASRGPPPGEPGGGGALWGVGTGTWCPLAGRHLPVYFIRQKLLAAHRT